MFEQSEVFIQGPDRDSWKPDGICSEPVGYPPIGESNVVGNSQVYSWILKSPLQGWKKYFNFLVPTSELRTRSFCSAPYSVSADM